ncbi:MAG: phytoene desaturase family protein [Phycisphaerales bacterium]|nr:phytoene desaturase family protein [Phycisphaerales bacterium]
MTQHESHADVIVIGGGLAGLATTVELARRGIQVTLVERNTHLGGKMNVLTEQGYSFDMGPTILTKPDVLRGIITRCGRKTEDYIDLIRLDPQWRAFYEDGTVLDLKEGDTVMAESLNAQFDRAKPAEGYQDFLAFSRRMNRLSNRVFYYKDIGGIRDVMRHTPPTDIKLLKDVMAMRMHSTVGSTVHRHIKEPHLQQMVEHFMQYVGSSPFLAPAILSVIASIQVDEGCWYAKGGTRSVARSLVKLAEEFGATLLTGNGVQSINTDGKRVTGVTLDDGSQLSADSIVSNCDVQRTYRDLMETPEAKRESRSIAKNYKPACSGLVLFLGLDKQYDHLAHHNFVFSKDSKREFNDIYNRGVPAEDPTLYLAVPSRSDPDQAPEGCEALYVLIHTAPLQDGHRWEGPGGILESYLPTVMEKLKNCGRMPDIEQHVRVHKHLTPNDIESRYNAEGGAIYGLASHGRLRGGFKPKNRSKAYSNLYLTGGSANPGPGVPMVLMSGVTAARCLCEDLGLDPDADAPAPSTTPTYATVSH